MPDIWPRQALRRSNLLAEDFCRVYHQPMVSPSSESRDLLKVLIVNRISQAGTCRYWQIAASDFHLHDGRIPALVSTFRHSGLHGQDAQAELTYP